MAREPKLYDVNQHPKTLIIGVQAPYNKTPDIQSYFEEFENLVKSNGVIYDHEIFIKLREIDNTYFFTLGKLKDIRELCDQEEIEEIIISEPLTGQQERNLKEFLHCRIFDRTRLILEIFEKGAHSAEGKLQIEIAMLQHKKARLAGRGIYMSQQGARIGTTGPGETQKEIDARHIETSILKLKRQLVRLRQARETQRKQRLNSQIPLFCLIGYTNAGKSSILNALTKSNVLAENKLFATLDTTTRELYIDSKKKGLISDTVGFIQQLPHHLVEAFKSTLSELNYADLLIQVIDISDPNWEAHIAVVHKILEDLDVDKQMLYVFNKADKVEMIHFLKPAMEKYEPFVITSTLTKDGIAPLVEFLQHWEKPAPVIKN